MPNEELEQYLVKEIEALSSKVGPESICRLVATGEPTITFGQFCEHESLINDMCYTLLNRLEHYSESLSAIKEEGHQAKDYRDSEKPVLYWRRKPSISKVIRPEGWMVTARIVFSYKPEMTEEHPDYIKAAFGVL